MAWPTRSQPPPGALATGTHARVLTLGGAALSSCDFLPTGLGPSRSPSPAIRSAGYGRGPLRGIIAVAHVRMETRKPFVAVKTALEGLVPPLNAKFELQQLAKLSGASAVSQPAVRPPASNSARMSPWRRSAVGTRSPAPRCGLRSARDLAFNLGPKWPSAEGFRGRRCGLTRSTGMRMARVRMPLARTHNARSIDAWGATSTLSTWPTSAPLSCARMTGISAF